MPVYVKAHRRGKSLVRAYRRHLGYAVTAKNKKWGGEIIGKRLSKREASILRGQLRRGQSKGDLYKSTFYIKPFYGRT